METLSFVLGIAFVVVIALAMVATYAFFKVIKAKKELEELRRDMSETTTHVYQSMAQNQDALYRRIDNLEREVFSQLDSRLDKLENKLTTKK